MKPLFQSDELAGRLFAVWCVLVACSTLWALLEILTELRQLNARPPVLVVQGPAPKGKK